MEKNLENYRQSYEKGQLDDTRVYKDPFDFFKHWFDEAEDCDQIEESNAMNISTLGTDGFPKTRVVLLKEISESGFVFYTNYDSEKGRALAAHPEVCLSFFWPPLQRQVIVKGVAEKLSPQKSDDYFHKRPKGSQLGAMVSPQSEKIPSRSFLENRQRELEKKYTGDQPIERPLNWGGYHVKSLSFEFWQGRANRLHDRFLYEKKGDDWEVNRLAP